MVEGNIFFLKQFVFTLFSTVFVTVSVISLNVFGLFLINKVLLSPNNNNNSTVEMWLVLLPDQVQVMGLRSD